MIEPLKETVQQAMSQLTTARASSPARTHAEWMAAVQEAQERAAEEQRLFGPKQSSCYRCGQLLPKGYGGMCKDCATEEIRRKEEYKLRAWEDACPPLYRDTDPARLDQDKLRQVLEWKFSPRGLTLHGPTSAGKTRCAFLLVKRLILEDGREVRCFLADEFGRKCSAAFADAAEGDAWEESLVNCEVLFLDDLGKFRLTDRVESVLFSILELRSSQLRPTIATTNAVGASLIAMMSPDRGPGLVRRLRDFSNPIAF